MIRRLGVISALMIGAMGSNGMAQETWRAKVGGQFLNTLEASDKKQSFDALVYMRERADFSKAKAIRNKKTKSRYVHGLLRQTATKSQKDLLAYLSAHKIKHQSYYISNLVALFDVDRSTISEIAGRDDVAKVLGDPTFKAVAPLHKLQFIDDRSKFRGVGRNITRTGADRFWSEFSTRGEGIVVAGQDTGIEWDHPALKNQYRGFDGSNVDHNYNWHDAIRTPIGRGNNSCGYASEEPCDDNGHGTHTLGTVVGDDGQGNQIGVAPGAKWIGCRNMDAGDGRPSTYIECFQFFLAPWPYGGDMTTDGNPDLGADVINNSWGCPRSEGCEGDEFLPVLEALEAAGIMVVVSAGNDGGGCGSIGDGPAHHSAETYSVGAFDDSDDTIAGFSSRGPSQFDSGVGPDITAPGVNVRSSVPGGRYSGWFWSGTSMAGPHVVGAVALLWSYAPDVLQGNIAETSSLLSRTAEEKLSAQSCGSRTGSQVPNNTFGHGLLNVYNAGAALGTP